MSDERGLRFAPDEAYPDMAAMLAEYRRVARDHAHNAGLVAITPEEHAERLALRAAVLRYGRALARIRGRDGSIVDVDVAAYDEWRAALEVLDALALALAEAGPG